MFSACFPVACESFMLSQRFVTAFTFDALFLGWRFSRMGHRWVARMTLALVCYLSIFRDTRQGRRRRLESSGVEELVVTPGLRKNRDSLCWECTKAGLVLLCPSKFCIFRNRRYWLGRELEFSNTGKSIVLEAWEGCESGRRWGVLHVLSGEAADIPSEME